jgi:hypothetical protein
MKDLHIQRKYLHFHCQKNRSVQDITNIDFVFNFLCTSSHPNNAAGRRAVCVKIPSFTQGYMLLAVVVLHLWMLC